MADAYKKADQDLAKATSDLNVNRAQKADAATQTAAEVNASALAQARRENWTSTPGPTHRAKRR